MFVIEVILQLDFLREFHILFFLAVITESFIFHEKV
jgi:hypothetical protein